MLSTAYLNLFSNSAPAYNYMMPIKEVEIPNVKHVCMELIFGYYIPK